MGNLESCIESLVQTTSLDNYFTIAFYMLGIIWALNENYKKSLASLKQALATFRELPRIDYEPLGMDIIIYAADIMELIRHISHHDYEIVCTIKIDKIFLLTESKQKSLEKIDFLGISTSLSLPSLTSASSSIKREMEEEEEKEKATTSTNCLIEKETLVTIDEKQSKYYKLYCFTQGNFSFDHLYGKLEKSGVICTNELIAYKDLFGDYVSITDEEDLRIAHKKLFNAATTKLNFRIIPK